VPSSRLASALPLVPVLAGLVLSVWRFAARDPVGGLAAALGGLLLMIVVAVRLPASPDG
jgi:hypothetical protein